jgi:hypothetical protein
MLKKESVLKTLVCITLMLTVCLAVSSCGKDEPNGKTKDPTNKKPTAAAGQAPIPLELPEAQFRGTPQPAKVPNLEKPTGRLRDPFMAPIGTVNVAKGKPVTSSDEFPIIGDLEYITDGDKDASDGCFVELAPGLQQVTVDLGKKYNIYAIIAWHYHMKERVYFDVIAQVADDADFTSNVVTLFNNDTDNSAKQGVGTGMHYVDTNEGRLIDGKGTRARYVRMYSKGNNDNDFNHYIEIAVYGKPIE